MAVRLGHGPVYAASSVAVKLIPGLVQLYVAFDRYTAPTSRMPTRSGLQQFTPPWDGLFPAEQARILERQVERLDISSEELNVQIRVDGLGGLARELPADSIGAAP